MSKSILSSLHGIALVQLSVKGLPACARKGDTPKDEEHAERQDAQAAELEPSQTTPRGNPFVVELRSRQMVFAGEFRHGEWRRFGRSHFFLESDAGSA
jgi:hypothetical protein